MNKENIYHAKKDLYIHESLFMDEGKLLTLLEKKFGGKTMHALGMEVVIIPKSFKDIPEGVFNEMMQIDELQQKAIITRNMAIKMIIDLLADSAYWKARFEAYVNDLLMQKLKELYELIEIKRKDLLFALNNGSITMDEFYEKYGSLINYKVNSKKDIIRTQETLRERER